MIEIKSRLRKWGNSFGIVVPRRAIENTNVMEGDEVTIFLKREKDNVLRDTFGTLKTKKSTEQIMREVDSELDSGF